MVEKRRTGISVEVDVGIGSNTVGATLGRLWGVRTGAQEIRMNKRMRRVEIRFIFSPRSREG